jgi:glycosyltransferase involved in cell wall biosynthesis
VAYLRNLTPLLAEHFARDRAGHSLRFLAHEEQAPLLGGVDKSQIYWVRGKRPTGYRRLLWERRNLTRIAAENGADILFTPYQIGPEVQVHRQVYMLRNMEPFLYREYHYSIKTRLRNFLLRRGTVSCLQGADRVIAVSGLARERLTQGLGIAPEKVRTIYHGRPGFANHVVEAKDRELLGQIGISDNYILTCGSLLPYRRCEDVIAGFNQSAPTLGEHVKLVIAGSGTDRRYWEMIRKAIVFSPFQERIQAVGHVSWETMGALYRRCRACVIATEIEACPNIAIEAMTSGCVIVSADRPPLPEMFRGCSLEYRARDIGHLAQQMRRAVEDRPLGRTLRERALVRAKDFSWEKCAQETYDVLTQWP